MGLRDRRQDRHAGRRGTDGGGAEIYQIQANVISIGDDYWIETTSGRRAFKVDGKAARVRDTMKIDRPGRPSATIKKAMITPLRDRFVLEADDVGQIAVQGNLVDHEYRFERDGSRIAEVPSAGYGYATRSA
jgi:uncharacterized protein YxjI